MTYAQGAHLVGGLAAPDARTAMTQAATVLGRHLHRITDGETGARAQWIWWQIDQLLEIPGIRMGEPRTNPETGNPDYSAFPGLVVEPDVLINPGQLGYLDVAVESYAVFKELREAGIVASGVRFQVSVPTPYGVVVSWSEGDSQRNLWPVYRAALFAEVEAIQQAIPAEDLAIQFDVAVEIGVLEGALVSNPELAGIDVIAAELIECVRTVHEPAQVGLHLCYGDYKHRHFKVPTDLGLAVTLANRVTSVEHLDFIHMPVDREAGMSASYFTPLTLLESTAELALGLIDYEDDSDRIDTLVAAADTVERAYSVATECGMARLGERGESVTLDDLLRQHARVASPVR